MADAEAWCRRHGGVPHFAVQGPQDEAGVQAAFAELLNLASRRHQMLAMLGPSSAAAVTAGPSGGADCKSSLLAAVAEASASGPSELVAATVGAPEEDGEQQQAPPAHLADKSRDLPLLMKVRRAGGGEEAGAGSG